MCSGSLTISSGTVTATCGNVINSGDDTYAYGIAAKSIAISGGSLEVYAGKTGDTISKAIKCTEENEKISLGGGGEVGQEISLKNCAEYDGGTELPQSNYLTQSDPTTYFGYSTGQVFSDDNNLIYTLNNTSQTCEVVGYVGKTNEISIPATVKYTSVSGSKNYAVTSVATAAFGDLSIVSKVTLKERSEAFTISNSAFNNSGALTEFTIEGCTGGVTIENYAFRNTSLESISLDTDVLSIGEAAFENTKIESVTIGPKVQEIGTEAFKGVTTLTDVTFPDSGDVVIKENAFCSAAEASEEQTAPMIETLTLTAGIKTIEADAFSDCASIKTIIVSSVRDEGDETSTTENSFPYKMRA